MSSVSTGKTNTQREVGKRLHNIRKPLHLTSGHVWMLFANHQKKKTTEEEKEDEEQDEPKEDDDI